MAGKSPPQFKNLNDTRDIVTLMTSFFLRIFFVNFLKIYLEVSSKFYNFARCMELLQIDTKKDKN